MTQPAPWYVIKVRGEDRWYRGQQEFTPNRAEAWEMDEPTARGLTAILPFPVDAFETVPWWTGRVAPRCQCGREMTIPRAEGRAIECPLRRDHLGHDSAALDKDKRGG